MGKEPAIGSNRKATKTINTWVYISASAFILSLIVAFLFMYFGQSLIGSDKSIVYFLILLPLGICASTFLFKVLKSLAAFKGKYLNYNLELTGPVVIFCLVISGGYWFYQHPPQLELFDLTILFKDEKAPSKLLNGEVTIRYGTKTGSFDVKNGEAI